VPILTKGVDFSNGDQVTAANLDALVDSATFASGAVDDSTTQLSGGAIIVKDGGVTSAKLATNMAVSGTFGVTGTTALTGNVGIGDASGSTSKVTLGGSISGATTMYGITSALRPQSGVTSAFYSNYAYPVPQDASFTMAAYGAFVAAGGSKPAAVTITTATGFLVTSAFTEGATNYGFRGNIASGSNRYNLYMDGTADNYLAGRIGIGSTPLDGVLIRGNLTGVTPSSNAAHVFYASGNAPSGATTTSAGFVSDLGTVAGVTALRHYTTYQRAFGGTVTTQVGFFASDTLTGATSNFGFQGALAAASGVYNLYMGGTAQNYLAGVTGIGVAASSTAALALPASTTGVAPLRIPHGTAPTSPVNGDLWVTSAGLYVRINGVTVGPLS
jgi:hypothetical protein